MWQRHGVPMEKFLDWPYRKRITYIASEIVESKNPVRLDTINMGRKGGG